MQAEIKVSWEACTCRTTVVADGPKALAEHIAIVTGKGKGKEAGASVVREAVTALLRRRHSPFQVLSITLHTIHYNGYIIILYYI